MSSIYKNHFGYLVLCLLLVQSCIMMVQSFMHSSSSSSFSSLFILNFHKNILLHHNHHYYYYPSRIPVSSIIIAPRLRRQRLRWLLSDCSFQSSTTTTTTTSRIKLFPSSSSSSNNIVVIPEHKWRSMATHHSQQIYTLLSPGMITHTTENEKEKMEEEQESFSNRRRRMKKKNNEKYKSPQQEQENKDGSSSQYKNKTCLHYFQALDSKNPIYNFLIDYYGIRGSGSVRRLARWSPCPSSLLLLLQKEENSYMNYTVSHDIGQRIQQVSRQRGGIFLENAQVDDLGQTLTLRGMIPVPKQEISVVDYENENEDNINKNSTSLHGVLYHPHFLTFTTSTTTTTTTSTQEKNPHQDNTSLLTPFEWNYSLLKATKQHEPILHCHGLHEWAMLYPSFSSIQPSSTANDPKDHTHHDDNYNNDSKNQIQQYNLPPSSMFQSHIPLRVSPQVILETIQTRGTNCTHFDALRFFSHEALPYNTPTYTKIVTQPRSQGQLLYEQPACIHANMDLFKMALRLQPFISSTLVVEALEVALLSRTLDVEASPYDVSTTFGLGVVPVETSAGRALYKKRQVEIMVQGNQVRDKLIHAYETFLSLMKAA